MARKRQRRAPESGAVIQNRSGTWRARTYVGDGKHVSLGSFRTKADAERALLLAGADQQRGAWVDPRNGKVTLEAYANHWLAHRHNLRIRAVELYGSQLDNHIVPALGRRELSKLSTAEVRVWFANLVQESGLAPTTAAKCYRLLRTILNTAVEDELIVKNPCVIKGAATERSPERPIATIAQVDALANAIDPRWRALVLLATYGSLRWGELTALTRQRIDLQAGTVEVVEQALELSGGTRVLGPPKTDAGRRTIIMPAFVVDELADHMRRYVGPEPDAVVFTGPKGAPLRRGNWNGKWNAVRKAVGCDGLRFHDLRHTGNTLAASTGASTKELMARVGHSSARAALHYQHATRERDQAIAAALDAMARPKESRPETPNATRPLHRLPYTGPMSVQHFVDEQGRYDGKTLQELWPSVVDEVVRAVDPTEVILFGSVARGEDGPDSDIDLLVVFDHIEPAEKRPMMARIRSAIETFAPVDVIVTDPAEMAERHDDVGSILYWPAREGRPVYRRASVQAV